MGMIRTAAAPRNGLPFRADPREDVVVGAMNTRIDARERKQDIVVADGRPRDQLLMPSGLPVLATKLVPPPARTGIIPRTMLMSKLAGLPPIIVVIAPAGYGKSTAIAQWVARDERPIAWLSLDARDNDPYVLLNYIHVAVDTVAPLPDDVTAAIASAGPSIWTSAVPRLGAALAAIGRVNLILDDFDVVTDPDAADAILNLANHITTGTNLVLMGRTAGRLPLPRLIADGRVAVIGVPDLAFDSGETAAVMRAAKLDLPTAEIERISAQLEGWPAGVYLTARSMKHDQTWQPPAISPMRVESPLALGPSISELASEYLRTELLERLAPDDMAFALHTSVLERLSGPLCDALLGLDDSAERLRSWETSNLFLIPLDSDHTWYRYHHLLHGVLTTELARREPEVIRALHRRAAAWHLEQGLDEQAFEHLRTGDEQDQAVRLFPQLLMRAYNSGRVETANRWADWLEGTGTLDRNLEALLMGTLMFRLVGDSGRADRWSDIGDRWRPQSGDASAQRLEALRRLLRAVAMRSGPEAMLEDARRAAEGMDRSDPWRVASVAILGAALLVSNLDVDADLTLRQVLEEAADGRSAQTAVALAAAYRAHIAIERNDWATVQTMVRAGEDLVTRNHLGDQASGLAIAAVAARLDVHLGRHDAARAHLARTQRIRPMLNHALPWLAVGARLDLAAAHLALADPAGARTLLQEIREIMMRRPKLGRLAADADRLQSRLQEMRGGSPGASTLTIAELRVLPLLSTHLSFQEIAERLFVSRHTVKSQAISIYRKLDATSRSEAIERAVALGLIDSGL